MSLPATDHMLHSRILKEELCARVEVLEIDGRPVVRKTYYSRPFLLWRTFLLTSRAAREYRNLAAIHAAGVACVRPVSWSETRVCGCVPSCAVLTDYVADAPSLEEVMRAPDTGVRRELATAVGRLIGDLHRAGIVSCRITPRNFLVPGGARSPHGLMLCDQPAAVRFRDSVVGRSAALIDLYDMAFSPSRLQMFSCTERLRMLIAYTEGERATARTLWRKLRRRPRWWNRSVRSARSFLGNQLRGGLRSLRRGRLYDRPEVARVQP